MACPTFSAVPKRLVGYPQWDVDILSGDTIVVDKVHVAWSELVTYANTLYPTLTITGSSLAAVIPAGWPGNTNYRARKFTITPLADEQARTTSDAALWAGAGLLPVYDAAVFTITYGLPNWGSASSNDPIVFLRHSWSTSLEYLTIQPNGWVWSSTASTPVASVEEGVGASLVLPIRSHQVDFPLLINPPFAAIRSLEGKVNSVAFTFRTGVCPIGTLLFLGADVEEQWLATGVVTYQMSYKFAECTGRIDASDGSAAGWNHFWRPTAGTNGWYKVQRASPGSGSPRPFGTGNFNPLFGLTT